MSEYGAFDFGSFSKRFSFIPTKKKFECDWMGEHVLACPEPMFREDFDKLKKFEINSIISLTEIPARKLLPNLTYHHIPVKDFTSPTLKDIKKFTTLIDSEIAQGRKVMVHCTAGKGRTGTMLSAYLATKGVRPDTAIKHTRKKRPGSVETVKQEDRVFDAFYMLGGHRKWMARRKTESRKWKVKK